MRPVSLTFACLLVLALTPASLSAAPTGWRGNGHNVYEPADPPIVWNSSSNVVWSTSLPDWGNATPLVLEERVFVTCEPTRLLCLSTVDGTILWERTNGFSEIFAAADIDRAARARELQRQFGDLQKKIEKDPSIIKLYADMADLCRTISEDPKSADAFEAAKSFAPPPKHDSTGYMSPSPATDGTHVYVLTGWGTAARYDLQGNRAWIRLVTRPRHGWGHSASPVPIESKVLIHIGDTLFALDAATGATVWETKAKSNWGTPAPILLNNIPYVVTSGGEVIRIADGKLLLPSLGNLPWTSPLVKGDTVYLLDENIAKAVKLAASEGDALTAQVLWEGTLDKNRYYASPALADGLLYAVQQSGILSVLDAATGATVFTEKLGVGITFPSPCVAGGRVYCSDDKGTTVVFLAGREYKELARNKLEPFKGTPTFVGNRVYIRGMKKLYCVGR